MAYMYESFHGSNISVRSIILCMYTAISIKVVHEQSGKVEYEPESCWKSLTN
jgi:hypothetical protein